MNAFTQFLYNILAWFNGLVGNYGVAIMMLTILIRMICMPFDYKSRKNMRKMTALQPKINELQKKYANDPAKLQKKQAELMRQEGASTLAGCLPMLLTYPLLLAMFGAMRAIANEQLALQAFKYLAGDQNVITAADRFLWVKNIWMSDSPFTPIAPIGAQLNVITADVWSRAFGLLSEGQQAGVLQSIAAVTEQALDFTTTEAASASVASILEALGQIPAYAAAITTVPGWSNVNLFLGFISITVYQQFNGFLILPILAGAVQMLQYKFNPQMTEQQQAQANNPQGAGMGKFMQYFFPILFVVFCLSSNAGFAVYWVTSSIVMWVQSIIITNILKKQDEKKAQSLIGKGSVNE